MSKPGSLNLFILSPERKLLEGEHVQKVSVFTTEGEVEVFPGHEDYLCQLDTGKFSYQTVAGKTVRGVIDRASSVMRLTCSTDCTRFTMSCTLWSKS